LLTFQKYPNYFANYLGLFLESQQKCGFFAKYLGLFLESQQKCGLFSARPFFHFMSKSQNFLVANPE
jgi:hypothetical protein